MTTKHWPLGTSTFIAGEWITPEGVAILDASPLEALEVASPGNWKDLDSVRVQEGLQALAGSRLTRWSLHTTFGRRWDISTLDDAVRLNVLDVLRRDFEMAAQLGCQVAVVHPSAEPITPQDRPARMAQSRRSLAKVVEMAKEYGLVAALEPLPRTCLGNTADEFALLLEDLPAERLGICLDVNHANVGQDLVAFIHRFNSRIVTLHISDNDGLDEKHWMPGRGVIDWPGTIIALREVGYEGAWIYEVDLDGFPLADRLTQLGQNLGQLLARADAAAKP